MTFISFKDRWSNIKNRSNNSSADESSLFVDINQEPITQRQLNLYYYFIFIKEILKKIEAKNFIEIGCGRATTSLYLARYLNLKAALLDNEKEAIAIARSEFIKKGLTADFYVADALNCNLADNSFDAIISIGLAEHINDTGQLLKEEYRLLRPGGVMISLNVPKKFSIQFLNTIMRFLKKIFGQYKESVRKDYYRNDLGPKDYTKIAEKIGFKNIKIINVCPFPIYTPIKLATDKKITKVNKFILKIRGLFLPYPYKTNYLISQAHFLVGYKK